MKTKKKHLAVLFLGLVMLVGYMPQLRAQEVYTVVHQMPQYPGGETAMQKFIGENLKYPVDAQTKGIEGRVVVRFVVGADGQIGEATIVRGISPSCDAEVLRVIQLMPKWLPGKKDGKNVAVFFNVPFQFKLQSKAAKDNRKAMYISDGKEIPETTYNEMVAEAKETSKIMVEIVLNDYEAVSKYGQEAKDRKVIEVRAASK